MIVPERLTNFNRTDAELEELIMFSVAVAGKTASTTAKAMNVFFNGLSANDIKPSPLGYAVGLGERLKPEMERARLGKYNLLSNSWQTLYWEEIDLKTASVQRLDDVHGIGPKTARMFVLHTRPKQRLAVLDTHILKFIGQNLCLGLVPANKRLPKSTPSGKMYIKIEDAFLNWIDNRVEKGALRYNIGAHDSYQGTVEIPVFEDGSPDYAGFDLNLWNFYTKNANT